MFILMATPEAAPFARAGNLAEVIYGLSRALVRSGHRMETPPPGERRREGDRTGRLAGPGSEKSR